MTPTQTIKQYSDTVRASGRSVTERLAEGYKTSFLAAVGASDLAVERTRTVVDQLRNRVVALPGEAQVQADLASKEARMITGLVLAHAHGWLAGLGGALVGGGAMLVWKYHVFPWEGVTGMVLVAAGMAAMALAREPRQPATA